MKIFEIISYDGITCEFINANSEREALCNYLKEHQELDDVVFYQSINRKWKLAKYDCEDEYFYANLV